LCCNRFLRHSSHSPACPSVPPQAHFRCKSPDVTFEQEMLGT